MNPLPTNSTKTATTSPSITPVQQSSAPVGPQAAGATTPRSQTPPHATNSHLQPTPAQFAPQTNEPTSKWSEIHTFFYNRLGSVGFLIAVTGTAFAVLAWQDSHLSTRVAAWSAKKTFIENCNSQEPNLRSSECRAAVNTTLPPPLGSSFFHFRRFLKFATVLALYDPPFLEKLNYVILFLGFCVAVWLLSVAARFYMKEQDVIPSSDLRELRRATRFTDKEIKQSYKEFLKDYPSGKVSETEVLNIYERFFPMGDPKAFAGHVFKRFDTKKNGYIEITEFIIALSVTKNGTAEEKLHWEFGFYDIDGDGFITRDEMLQIVDATYKMTAPLLALPEHENTPAKRVDNIFRMLETDGLTRDSMDLAEFIKISKTDPSAVPSLPLV